MTNASMDIPEYELSIIKSLIFFLQNKIPTVNVGGVSGQDITVNFYAPFPYYQYEDKRLLGSVVTVSISKIAHSGWKIGSDVPNQTVTSDTETTELFMPFIYDLSFAFNCYSSSEHIRMKLDGAIMKALMEINKTGCPVFQFQTDTSSATAYDTGARIYIQALSAIDRVYDEDIENHDYLTNWSIEAKCPYIYQTVTQVATSIAITGHIIQ